MYTTNNYFDELNKRQRLSAELLILIYELVTHVDTGSLFKMRLS